MTIILMIESGKPLQLVREYIADRQRVATAVQKLAKELGASEVWTDRIDGTLRGVDFASDAARHPDFKRPARGRNRGCYPKKGTQWYARLLEQRGHTDQSSLIAKSFDIPLTIRYSFAGGTGHRCIGLPLTECGFLYLSAEGPYAMWIPDVAAEVKADEQRGHIVDERAKSFKPEIEGCRRIEPEEWTILVAQHELAEKRAKEKAAS